MSATAGQAIPKIEPTIGGSVYVKPSHIAWEPTQFEGFSIKDCAKKNPRGGG